MNVVVICCDTLRVDVVNHTWEDPVETPNLDALRRESAVFTNAWAEGLPTIPMRRNFYTGIRSYPWRYQIDDRGSFPNLFGWHAIPTEHTTVAEHLAANGVMTGLVADLYHMFKPTMNFTRGFLSWEFIRGQENDPYRTGPLSDIDLTPYLPDDLASPERRPGLAQYLLNVRERKSEEDYFAARVFRSAARWLEENRDNAPFFLCIESFTPHELWDPPTPYADRYFKQEGVRDFIYPQLVQSVRPLTEDEIRRTRALYYGYVTFLDRWIGHFLNTLDALDLWDETAIFFLSDHGTQLMDKTQFGKSAQDAHPFNTQIHLWMRHPDRDLQGKEIDAIVQSTEVAPTILSLFGVEHEELDGFDVTPLVTGERAEGRSEAILAWGPIASIRTDRWNLILNTVNEDPNPRLYDIVADPKEDRNVASDHPGVVRDLTSRLEDLLGEGLPVTYTHQPTSKYNLRLSNWVQSNLAR